MCYPVTCSSCKKATWGGCGAHVESVMKSVPASGRCTCKEDPDPAGKSGIFSWFFGR